MGCDECGKWIDNDVYEWSMKNCGRPLCRNCQRLEGCSSSRQTKNYSSNVKKEKREPTSQARKLAAALRKRKIKCELEMGDGHKHVDIAIAWADLYIEIDGSQHRYDAKQMYSDIARDEYSHDDGVATRRFTNFDIDNHCDEVADAIAAVARKRYYEMNPR